MENNSLAIKLFEGKNVRVAWDAEKEKYYFSVVDVVQVLTDSPRPRKYWSALKSKLKAEGDEVSQKLGQLKLLSPDGKKRETDVADLEEIFRIIQTIPSPKAEPLKRWLAEVTATELSRQRNPKGMQQTKQTAREGGEVAKSARQDIETRLGHTVISSERASDYIRPIEDAPAKELPLEEEKEQWADGIYLFIKTDAARGGCREGDKRR